jgi:uncharacterized protein YuzE
MTLCKNVYVKKNVCYIKFFEKEGKRPETKNSWDGTDLLVTKQGKIHLQGFTFYTVRGEQMIMDFDKQGRVIGIELLGSEEARKPCQTSTTRKKGRRKKILRCK